MKAHAAFEMCGADGNTGNVTIIGMPNRLFWLLKEGAVRILVDTETNDKLCDEEFKVTKETNRLGNAVTKRKGKKRSDKDTARNLGPDYAGSSQTWPCSGRHSRKRRGTREVGCSEGDSVDEQS